MSLDTADPDPPVGYRPAGPLALLDPRASSLGCARCGACCESIVLGFDPRAVDPGRDPENEQLYRDHWRVEWVDDHDTRFRDSKWTGPLFVVTCNAYDADRRLCTHPNRPPICRDYPHYATVPDAKSVDRRVITDQDGQAQPFGCSFLLDAPGWSQRGRPLIPVEVLRG